MKTAFDQMTETEVAAVGLLIGVDVPGASFRNFLRDMPPLPGGWTMGDMARAYLKARTFALTETQLAPVDVGSHMDPDLCYAVTGK